MTKEECFKLGAISKLYSFKGEVILFIDNDQPEVFYNLDAIFIEVNNQLIPFFIEKTTPSKVNQIRLKLEGIDNEEEAKKLVKKSVYLPLAALPELNEEQLFVKEISGYTLLDQNKKVIGTITAIIDNPGNPLIEVDVEGKEVLLPFNDELTIGLDKEKKEISLHIPDGLLDLYL